MHWFRLAMLGICASSNLGISTYAVADDAPSAAGAAVATDTAVAPNAGIGAGALVEGAPAADVPLKPQGPLTPQGPFTYPPALERDVRFWIRVYTEVTTNQGLIHDDWNLGLVYEVLHFDPGASPAQRERKVSEAKSRYAVLLRRFAAGDNDHLTPHELRILHAFGEHPTSSDFREAIDRLRFQLGQADRFHEGLIRAAAWESHIAKTLVARGVPAEIAALPHVESSFNLAAYSKVGAAGLWQFMPSTARRFMRVDNLVDERLDPYTATEAAANLMLYNFRLLGTWPLTVTAYNHGPGGLRRAQDDLGTSDIDVIVKRYQGATFGFASRNFYVAFLAALEVDRHAQSYFGPITRLPDTESTPVELSDYIPIEALAKAFKVDMGALRVLNPALRPPIWSGSRFVPRGYSLRVPGTPPEREIAAAWSRLPANQRYLAQRNDGSHRMRKGETLASVAAASGMAVGRLLAANGFASNHVAARGSLVRIPLPASRADVTAGGVLAATSSPSATPAPTPTPPVKTTAAATSGMSAVIATPSAAVLPAPVAATVPAPAAVIEKVPSPPAEPVSVRQTDANTLLPAASPTGNSDTTDYGVRAGDVAIVQAGETLGHFADWTQVDAAQLRTINKLKKSARVTQGRKLKLDLSKVSAAQFTATRRAYHQHVQDVYFAAHRIAGTDTYAVKRGDSLWTIAQQHGDLPIWLVAQYNPDVDFNNTRPGTPITLPRVAAINRE